MDDIKRRALVGWVLGAVVIVALFVWAVASRPTMEGASAGVVSRFGLLSAVAVLPMLLAARTISKFTDDNAVAAVVLPVFLAVGVGVLVVVFGFTAENAKICAAMERYDLDRDPACYTSTATRLSMLAEGLVAWAVFGLLLAGLLRLRERKEVRTARA